ncbi:MULTISPECIES: bifunctional phosphoribosylaminoimidazolecarboxamide formyltransferase/IMP cyclohydrolase [unclassified Paracoccus (in: a-proteobacteria)]|uniref:bifunctional phosphoribosylaminoimidazolecarboxamide formyltransferase/IMP cyclohydrolase n=1 Tax=unclassified Paracoccus (in: a-proteobacteria) TaxID=2688777 RepID=UPI0015FF97C9|nr:MULTISPECIES: bifunctional phosphoribosylaminoimidazolecarboxamide formyltransferase/IMP cyclohydrolase [unclassified Paracoccus (in: a-proteobacteria)]MBB1492109.1 bifunctional phosphoribosylaminoimidazolecarboxamide formyltransferase/IMP cyclohydrolase [Paracoccus sp. MC1854]MBB1497995.1 bifunctional phosphoribosylaminoimidazolecarboxamide formyltransferase/IMP cyclohydrolase [Paracoccus sp. MC1862]QQO44378.1 bifunctional phosphoribosylaminoimidazolecarboxamide formyltransferase/IMP cyclohy
MTDRIDLRRALISVSDKKGLVGFAQALAARGVELLSTGGTARALREAGLKVRDVSELTGFPEMMDGRVKTLHPAVHGGLLALRDNADHRASMDEHGIAPIDLLVVNLYPFEETVAKGSAYDDCIENIDIGGPAMIRAAAKNHAFVTTVVDVQDYGAVLAELDANGGATTLPFRKRMAQTAYARTAAYDAAVSTWMAQAVGEETPRRRAFAGTLAQPLRYGENPHQAAAFYTDSSARPGVATARQWQGKELSYNNINDTDAAFELVAEFTEGPAVAIIKHANPCGVARAETLEEAYRRAFDCDRTSAFGGIVALNGRLDAATARAITEIFTEVVIAPDADDEARAIFAAKKNLRLLTTGGLPDARAGGLTFRQVAGGFLVQTRDTGHVTPAELRVVTQRQPSEAELADLMFAWTVAKHVKSNAIVYAKDRATVGIGAGQMSRVDSTRIGRRKSEDMAEALGLSAPLTEGAAVASDAFFPFADGIEALAEAGARAVIQPGGSMRDEEVIAAADRGGLAMVFTGQRHFRH